MARKTFVFYHRDLDGKASKWAASVALRNLPGVEYIPIQYGDKIPYEKFITESEEFNDDDVYFVDFMPLMEDIERLSRVVGEVFIVDHHKGRADDLSVMQSANWMGAHPNVTVVFDLNHAGCTLTWHAMMPSSPIPHVLLLAEDYDLWIKHHGIYADMLDELMNRTPVGDDILAWDSIGALNMTELKQYLDRTDSGVVFKNKYQNAQHAAKHKVTVVKHWGKNIALSNVVSDIPLFVSEMSKREDVDFAIGFFVVQDAVVFSFRSCKDKVLPYAKELGGGGHELACSARLPLKEGFEFLQTLLATAQ
jgi:oligoribonuclease NrnB/cAMP/cGMP phosphodiesterase (DHH superfamily)